METQNNDREKSEIKEAIAQCVDGVEILLNVSVKMQSTDEAQPGDPQYNLESESCSEVKEIINESYSTEIGTLKEDFGNDLRCLQPLHENHNDEPTDIDSETEHLCEYHKTIENDSNSDLENISELKIEDESQNSLLNEKKMTDNDKSTNTVLPWRSRDNKMIHYTRRYLLDCRYHALCTTFPDCLKKFLATGELPLRRAENPENMLNIPAFEDLYDCRNMDHILFYTSLPYSNMRSPPLSRSIVRKQPKMCY